MNEYIAKLNPEQLQAATATDGAVLVLAGAGSGKTRVLTSRIAYILEQDLCYPSQILAITFTNKAANEMRARLSEMVGEDVNAMWISTIHSMCLRMLRANIQRLDGYKNNFTVYSEVDTDRVIKRIISEMNLEGDILKNAK
ncbi:MAG: UvrD-helicase domain-containing protein, partial [Clostridia bacterium]|nr:UvrD-helicase domain-containing protein [Clostridia bacterium]